MHSKCLALLHDTYEDARPGEKLMVYDAIVAEFGQQMADEVVMLSRKKEQHETYYEFIMRIVASNNWRVMEVKVADLDDNLDGAEPGSRTDKYWLARHLISAARAEAYINSIP